MFASSQVLELFVALFVATSVGIVRGPLATKFAGPPHTIREIQFLCQSLTSPLQLALLPGISLGIGPFLGTRCFVFVKECLSANDAALAYASNSRAFQAVFGPGRGGASGGGPGGGGGRVCSLHAQGPGTTSVAWLLGSFLGLTLHRHEQDISAQGISRSTNNSPASVIMLYASVEVSWTLAMARRIQAVLSGSGTLDMVHIPNRASARTTNSTRGLQRRCRTIPLSNRREMGS